LCWHNALFLFILIPKSLEIMDCELIREMARVNGDLGRSGGLLKLWLTYDEHAT